MAAFIVYRDIGSKKIFEKACRIKICVLSSLYQSVSNSSAKPLQKSDTTRETVPTLRKQNDPEL